MTRRSETASVIGVLTVSGCETDPIGPAHRPLTSIDLFA